MYCERDKIIVLYVCFNKKPENVVNSNHKGANFWKTQKVE